MSEDGNGRPRGLQSIWEVVLLVAIIWLFFSMIGSAKTNKPGKTAGMLGITVYDGDTFTLAGEKIRLVNVDTPELFSPHCDAEKRLARVARLRLKQLLGSGEGLSIDRYPLPDRFGRTLARVSVNGKDVGKALISEGLATPWEGRRHSWCCG
jgi:endonuclease YncB( thermonuclease family)